MLYFSLSHGWIDSWTFNLFVFCWNFKCPAHEELVIHVWGQFFLENLKFSWEERNLVKKRLKRKGLGPTGWSWPYLSMAYSFKPCSYWWELVTQLKNRSHWSSDHQLCSMNLGLEIGPEHRILYWAGPRIVHAHARARSWLVPPILDWVHHMGPKPIWLLSWSN